MNIAEKIQKMIKVAGDLEAGTQHIEVVHEAGCPAIKTQCLEDCRCTPDFKIMRPN